MHVVVSYSMAAYGCILKQLMSGIGPYLVYKLNYEPCGIEDLVHTCGYLL